MIEGDSCNKLRKGGNNVALWELSIFYVAVWFVNLYVAVRFVCGCVVCQFFLRM